MSYLRDYEQIRCTVTVTGASGKVLRTWNTRLDDAIEIFAEVITSPGLFAEPIKEVRVREENPKTGKMITTGTYKFPST